MNILRTTAFWTVVGSIVTSLLSALLSHTFGLKQAQEITVTVKQDPAPATKPVAAPPEAMPVQGEADDALRKQLAALEAQLAELLKKQKQHVAAPPARAPEKLPALQRPARTVITVRFKCPTVQERPLANEALVQSHIEFFRSLGVACERRWLPPGTCGIAYQALVYREKQFSDRQQAAQFIALMRHARFLVDSREETVSASLGSTPSQVGSNSELPREIAADGPPMAAAPNGRTRNVTQRSVNYWDPNDHDNPFAAYIGFQRRNGR